MILYSIYQIFLKYLPHCFILIDFEDFENMADYTNRYAHQKNNKWQKNTDKWKIRTFIALHILTGN